MVRPQCTHGASDHERKSPGPRDQPLSAPAQGQPRALAGVGAGGAGRGQAHGQAHPALGRLRRLPLVPRHGARELRGRGHRRRHERAFVNIKVDREERPDIDAIYMRALHALGEQGGWPLTMFLDSDARPFWGGTYFPPTPRYGRPGFSQVLREVARVYREEPEKIAPQHRPARRCLEASAPPPARRARPRSAIALLADLTRAHGLRRRSTRRRSLGARPSSRNGASSGSCGAAPSATTSEAACARRRQHAHAHLPGRHLRSPRRRLRPLLGRRPLARAALREDALRQRPARRPHVRGLPRDRQGRSTPAASMRRSAGSCAR